MLVEGRDEVNVGCRAAWLRAAEPNKERRVTPAVRIAHFLLAEGRKDFGPAHAPIAAAGERMSRSTSDLLDKRLAESGELALQALGAIAVLAGPGFGAVVVATVAAVMRVLHFDEIEVLLPIRPLFKEGRRAVADFDPAGGAVGAKAGVLHISKVFAAGDGASAEGAVFDRLEERLLAVGLDSGAHQVAHGVFILLLIRLGGRGR